MADPFEVKIQEIVRVDSSVKLLLSDGQHLLFEDCWLRDQCRCEQCYHAATFQRALHILDIPEATPAAATIAASGAALHLTWNDGHESSYSLDFLLPYKHSTWLAARVHHPVLWRRDQISKLVARVNVIKFLDSQEEARRLFKSLLDYGVAFIEGVSLDVEGTEQVCKALGGVQRTLFGDMWKFSSIPDHADTAYTNLSLAPHTDNTYFTEAAGLQVLHCLEHTGGTGGDTVLVDGFEGATLLRQKEPQHFDCLARHESEAEYLEPEHHHRHAAPIIQLNNTTGQLKQIRFNVYDRSPAVFTSGEECRAYYSALRSLARIYQDPEHQWWFKLTPGSVMVMDNFRLLHGRSGYTGHRVLCGSYVARSDWLDRARVLGLIV